MMVLTKRRRRQWRGVRKVAETDGGGFSMSDAFEKCAQKVENWLKVSNGDVGDASRKDMRVHY